MYVQLPCKETSINEPFHFCSHLLGVPANFAMPGRNDEVRAKKFDLGGGPWFNSRIQGWNVSKDPGNSSRLTIRRMPARRLLCAECREYRLVDAGLGY
jgi:hypothetical protein